MLEAAVRSVDRAPPRSRATQPATEKLVQIESLRLHHFPATRSARAKWILYETVGDAFETVVVDLYRRAQYRPEFLLLNPNHNVPVLEICWASGETTTMLESAKALRTEHWGVKFRGERIAATRPGRDDKCPGRRVIKHDLHPLLNHSPTPQGFNALRLD